MKKLIILFLFLAIVTQLYAAELKKDFSLNLDTSVIEKKELNNFLTEDTVYINNGSDILPLAFVPHNSYEQTKYILPTKYDLRDDDYIMPARNQGDFGTCWAFSTAAVLESCGMKKYGLDSISISPLNIANREPLNISDMFNDWGGGYHLSMAYLSQMLGPVDEKDNPYKTPWTSDKPVYNLIGVSEKSALFEDGTFGLSDQEISAIKEAVYNNGAV